MGSTPPAAVAVTVWLADADSPAVSVTVTLTVYDPGEAYVCWAVGAD